MSRRGALVLAGALVLGFVLGGFAGWSQRPVEWQAGIWRTASASVDAATYGHAYESQAERVLLYFIYGGFAGTIVTALVVGVSRKFRHGKVPHAMRGTRNAR